MRGKCKYVGPQLSATVPTGGMCDDSTDFYGARRGKRKMRRLRAIALSTGLMLLVLLSTYSARAGTFSPNPGAIEQPTSDGRKGGPNVVRGDGIVLSTGNKVDHEQDFAVDEEMGLYLRRTYNHFWAATGLFGSRWLSNFDYSLAFSTVDGQSVAWAQRPDGRRIKFLATAANRWDEDKAQPVAYLVKNADGTYTLHNEARGTETYRSDGYITQRRNEHGIAWEFTYDGKQLQRVTHTSGRSVRFTWAGGVVTQVANPAGHVFQYSYTPNVFGTGRARLAGVILPGPPSANVSYHYEDSRFPGALTGKSLNEVRYSTFGYDDKGRAIRSERAGGLETYTFSYAVESEAPVALPPLPPPPGGYFADEVERPVCMRGVCTQPRSVAGPSVPSTMTVTETNPLGRVTTYLFENGRLSSVASGSKVGERTYDANGYDDIVHDFENGITDYDYDAAGRLLKRVDGVGTADARTTTYSWDTTNQRLTKVAVEGSTETEYAYDADHRPAWISYRNVSRKGLPGQLRKFAYTHTKHSNGLLASVAINGPMPTDTVTRNYGNTGLLLAVRNGLNQPTQYSQHNALGLPGRVVGPNGNVTELTYDPRGRVIQATALVGDTRQTTTYTYDAFGRVVSVHAPDGVTTTRRYDPAGRRLRETRPDGTGGYAQTRYDYNAASQVTSVVSGRTDQHDAHVPVPGVPLNVSAPTVNETGSYAVQWGAVSGATYYRLEESANGGAWQRMPDTAATRTDFNGKSTATQFAYRMRACNVESGCGPNSAVATVQRMVLDAAFVSQSVPVTMVAGQSYPVTVQLRNTGTTAWTSATGYALGAQNPADNSRWGTHRAAVTGTVAPGATATFAFNVIAPANGAHAFQWAMVRDGHGAFGATTPNVTVTTYSGSISASPNPCNIPAGASVCASTITWGTAPGGAEVWVSNLDGSAAQLFDGTNTGTAKAPWIPATGKRFSLRKHGLTLASVDVMGQLEARAAEFVTQSVPRSVRAGEAFPASVTFKNTGRLLWSDGYGYRIGSQSPRDNVHWGTARVPVAGTVTSQQHATFDFTARAPTTPGTYSFQWQLVQDGVTWFGPLTPKVDVVVAGGSISASANPCRILTAGGTCSSTISWNASHGGAEVWVTNLDGSYPQLFMPNTQSGSASAPWITTAGKRFHLKYGHLTLATVDVSGYLHPLPEPPEKPQCNPVTNICQQPIL